MWNYAIHRKMGKYPIVINVNYPFISVYFWVSAMMESWHTYRYIIIFALSLKVPKIQWPKALKFAVFDNQTVVWRPLSIKRCHNSLGYYLRQFASDSTGTGQSCSLGLDVSVSRRIFQTSRSRFGLGKVWEGLGLVSDWKPNVSSRSRRKVSFTSGHINNFFPFLSFSYKTCSVGLHLFNDDSFATLRPLALQLFSAPCSSADSENLQPDRPYNETNQISSVTKQAGKACVS